MDLDLDLNALITNLNAGIDDLDTLLAPPAPVQVDPMPTPDGPVDPMPTPDVRGDSMSTPEPAFVNLADVPMRSLTWLWPGWIPAGTFSILGGHVGDGKSTVIAAITAALTTGAPLPDGATTEPANVLVLSTEDDPARVLRPRLEANNADLSRVFIMKPTTHAGASTPARVNVAREADHLRQLITAHNIRLVVIDPVSSLLPGSDRATESTIRENLAPIMQLIEDTGVAILGAMRVGKTIRNTRPAQRLVGSSAFSAIARSVIMVARTPAEADVSVASLANVRVDSTADVRVDSMSTPSTAILEVVKSNYARPPQPVTLSIQDTGAVHWHGPANTGIDEAATPDNKALSRSELDSAIDFLREFLGQRDESVYSVFSQAKMLGFSEITIRRAKKLAGVESYRQGEYKNWFWRLPTENNHAP